ncbi:NAD-dependent epimerase/dehydratase family protein [Streptacidiphilus rugosus]|uniref:NAD-dependent epimerase/dehydratase family protein n=1 Tax=Streptacidiphilus rugosus TaxID=405783 RepID=UPI0005636DA2|nr:NAD-dependent epimerase/dehydratase family protein [Streptacidiphilus rugosus]
MNSPISLDGRQVCVIGGSRYFGRRLVQELRDAGAAVSVVNRGSAPPPPGVTHLLADRDDEAALRAALGDRRFDVVVDQVCYTPRQARVASRVFAGRTGRYVMTSTVEVYAELGRPGGAPLAEDALDLAAQRVDLELPWEEPAFLESHYGEGKRQAEAVFSAQRGFDFAAVRTAHVLGGADFTGRLAHYVERIDLGLPVLVHARPQPASFVHEAEIARFLAWAAAADFTGPVNAASQDPLDVRALGLALAVGREPVFELVTPGTAASPFSFDRGYPLNVSRAARLGFVFSRTADWLPAVAEEARA